MDQTERDLQSYSLRLVNFEIPEPDYDDVTSFEQDQCQQNRAARETAAKIDDWCDFKVARARMEETFSRDDIALALSLTPRIDEPAIPEPDYPDYDDGDCCDAGSERRATADGEDVGLRTTTRTVYLCPRSKEMHAIHRELTFNQKKGVNVLGNKSELSVEMNKRKLRQQQRDEDERRRQTRSLFDQRLEEQARKIAMAEEAAAAQTARQQVDEQQAEFIRVHSRIRKVKEVC